MRFLAVTSAALLLASAPSGLHAQRKALPASSDSAAAPAPAGDRLPPLPADAHAEQRIELGGKTLAYTVTVGTIPVYDAEGKKTAEVVFTAYILDGANDANRPVTFAFNGGPGASSVFLNFGAIGPKHIVFGNAGDSPSDPAVLRDNPGTWLDFTDLVFIDPVGTGFSRSLENAEQTKKDFYSTDNDIHYLSRVVFDWLVKNQRLQSRKYIVGESYGGYRVPRITHYLQSQLGVAMNGVVALSPYLNPTIEDNSDLSPIPWVLTLPSMAASNLERRHALTPAAMAPIIAYDQGQFVTDLMKGHTDPQALARLVDSVTALTGLPRTFVQQAGGRIEISAFLREAHRDSAELGSVYDVNVTAFDPFPFAPEQRSGDPLLESVIAPTTTAMVDFVTRIVGWHATGAYHTLSYAVNAQWDTDSPALRAGAVPDLREAVAADPKLRVLIAHGWNDLSCPFMGSVLTVEQMPVMGDPTRVSVHEYPGGHMFYTRPASQAALHRDVEAMVAAH